MCHSMGRGSKHSTQIHPHQQLYTIACRQVAITKLCSSFQRPASTSVSASAVNQDMKGSKCKLTLMGHDSGCKHRGYMCNDSLQLLNMIPPTHRASCILAAKYLTMFLTLPVLHLVLPRFPNKQG